MATRKQKHAAAVARREKFMADYRAEGLQALAEGKRQEEVSREKKNQHNRELAQQRKAEEDWDVWDITVGDFLQYANNFNPLFSDK